MNKKLCRDTNKHVLALIAMAGVLAPMARAADINWNGPTGSFPYTDAAKWIGGKVPGTNDNAVIKNGTNTVVLIDGQDWTVKTLMAGFGSGSGAVVQNGQTLALNGGGFSLGLSAGSVGYYTLNGGTVNYGAGAFNVGALGTGILEIKGGTISGNGNFAVNIGAYASAITASIDQGTDRGGFTWHEIGYNANAPEVGLPQAGSTVTTENHSYIMPLSYAANNAVMIDPGAPTATITLTPSGTYSMLSFLGSAGHGPMTLNYTVHHADNSVDTGTLTFPDWYGSGGLPVGGRVRGDGSGVESAGVGNNPRLYSVEISTTTASPITTIDLAWASGAADGHSCVMAVSGFTNGAFAPVAISGYNQDMVVEVGASMTVDSSVVDVVTQSAGSVNTGGGEFFVGNVGTGIYNMSGGSFDVGSWVAFGRAGGNGTFNMTGGVLNKTGGGNLLVGTGFQAPTGSHPAGVLNQSGGTVNSSGEFLVPENTPASGLYNLSGTGALNVNNYIVVGRDNGAGALNMSGGTITKTGNGSFVVGANGGDGTVVQDGGTIVADTSELVLGNGADAIWTMNGGTNSFNHVAMCQNLDSSAVLSLNGGLFQANGIDVGTLEGWVYSILNLDGGTLQATTNNTSFISGLFQANIGPKGVTIDSQAFNITIPQPLVGSGSITKKGNGTLTLSGADYFTGANVSAGTLVAATTITGGGDYVVANGAALNVVVTPSLNSTLPVGNLTFGNSSFSVDLGNFGNPSVAPVTAFGTLAVNGTVTVNIADANPQIGRFPLIQYTSRTGSGNFVIGSLPFAVGAVILTNEVNKTIDLHITSAELPRWNGQITGGVWDINSTPNWVNIGTGDLAVYKEGNAVLFDDNASGTPIVSLPGTVSPVSVEFKNDSISYTLQGSGKISGATGVKVNGAGNVTIATVNDFTGPVVLNNGTLTVNNLANAGLPSSIGKSPLVLAGGALNYSGPATTINRGYSLQNTTNSTIIVQAPLTLTGVVTAGNGAGLVKSGPAQLAYTTAGSNVLSGANSAGYRVVEGTALFDGSAGGQTNVALGGGLRAAGSATASVILTNTTIITGDLQMGDKEGTIGAVTVNTGANVTANGWTVLGDGVNSTGTLTVNDGTLNLSGGRLLMGGNPGSMSTLNINGGVINKSGDYFAVVNGGWNVVGTRTGVVNQANGTVNCSSELWVGDGGGAGSLSRGTYNLNGGTLTVNNWFGIGRGGSAGDFNMTGGTLNKGLGGDMVIGRGGSVGTFTMTGGTINKDNVNPLIIGQSGGTGIFNQSSGTLNSAGEYWIGVDNGTIATNNISGTAVFNLNNWMSIGRGGNATLNFSGGTMTKAGNGNFIVGDNGTGAFNQTGGTLTINNELWIAQAGGGNGTYNLSAGSVTNNSWLAVGREGGKGVLNITGGSMTKQGGGNVSITHGGGATALINQSGGTFTVVSGETWLGEDSGPATWNMSGGTASFGYLQLARSANATGTLNADGGTIVAYEIAGGSGTNVLSLNGAKIVAKDNHANFIHDIKTASIGSAGGTIDSQGFNITVPQVFSGNGASPLTKLGSGTLTLTGTNSYTNPNVVSAGKLAVNTKSTASGDYTIANNAGLGVVLQAAGEQFMVANLTSAGSFLDLDLGAFGNPTLAPLNVLGTFAVNGTLTINIADSLAQVGNIPLVKYGSRAGSGNIVLGVLPVGVQATLATNVTTSTIELVVTYAGIPRWEGLVEGGVWDINSTVNWVDRGTSDATVYQEGSAVLFDDRAAGTTNVTLDVTVKPGSVTVNNSNLTYTISGSGKISGSTGLNKQGAGNIAINTSANDYTGPTIVSGGKVTVASLANGGLPSAIGASSASPTNLVLANGTLSYTGPAVSINRGYSVQNTNSVLDVQSDLQISGPVTALTASSFMKTGPGSLTYSGSGSNLLAGSGLAAGYQVVAGTATFNGSTGGQTNRVMNDLWVGGTPASGASLVLTNTTLLVDRYLAVGRGNGTNGNVSTMSLYNSVAKFGDVSLGYANGIAGNKATQVLTLNNSSITAGQFKVGENGGSDSTLIMNGNSTITNSGDVNFAVGAKATVNINDNSVFHSQNRIQFGVDGGTSTVAVANSGTLRVNNAWFSVGNGNNGNGTLLVKDSGTVYVSGDFNVTDTGTSVGSMTVQDNAAASGNAFFVSKNGGTLGVVNMSGGSVTSRGGETWIGGSGNGTFNQTGGTMTVNNWMSIGRNTGGVGVYNISGGSLIKNNTGNRLNVGENGTGTLNVSGSANVVVAAQMDIARGSGTGTVNLNGGSITAAQLVRGNGTATFNFNGGRLVAGANANAAFMGGLTRAYIMTNGAVIDSGANSIAIVQPLLEATNGSGGGLTKLGSGTLSLNGANTYTGLTRVDAGTLSGTGSIAGPVTVGLGATIAVDATAIGTLTINNSLTLQAGSTTSVKITPAGFDKFNGLTAVTFGGALVVNNTAGPGVYKLFNIGGSGSFSSITILPSGVGSFNAATGELIIADRAAAINSITFSDGKLNISGDGGAPGTTYSILTSTNVEAPVSTWTTNSVGTFDVNGLFTDSITPTTGEPTRFYLIKTP